MILKGGGNYHSTGIVEVVWKSVTVILNFCFTPSITYHDSLHGFRTGRSTGTASLEVKLIQKKMTMLEEVLYIIFLDLHKVYYALESSSLMEILEGYGVGPRDLFLL